MNESTDDHEHHPHAEDRHVHGEPSRVLEGEPYPSLAVLYGSGENEPNAGVTDRDREYWHEQLVQRGIVEQLVVPSASNDERPDDEPPEHLEFLATGFEGFAKRLQEASSLLFVPSDLRMDEAAWEDLASNDVSVSWLAVDATRSTGERRVAVLSDWVIKLGPNVPRARTAGVTPGVFHLVAGHLRDFGRAARQIDDLCGLFNQFLDGNVKVRPGFLQGPDWSRGT